MEHTPVLLSAVLEGLMIDPDGVYVDGTFGRGGHSAALLARLSAQGHLIALDQDAEAVKTGLSEKFCDRRFSIVHDSFTALQKIIEHRGLVGRIRGILLDLGVSSPQLDDPRRGFSFSRNGPLDMRMNPERGMDAATWINNAQEDEMSEVFYRYGEERYARRLARAVVMARKEKPIETTFELSEILKSASPRWNYRIHPATRSFQAIRIFINKELDALTAVLQQSLEVLAPQGRLCVISFHSLEDRIVKRFIRMHTASDPYLRDLPIRHIEDHRRLQRIGPLIRPTQDEIMLNPRSRSARLRIAEKVK